MSAKLDVTFTKVF